MKIPFILLTNGGGRSEIDFITKINKIHSFNEDNPAKIRLEQLILNYTPLKKIMSEEYGNKVILVAGSNKPESIAIYAGAKKYITV